MTFIDDYPYIIDHPNTIGLIVFIIVVIIIVIIYTIIFFVNKKKNNGSGINESTVTSQFPSSSHFSSQPIISSQEAVNLSLLEEQQTVLTKVQNMATKQTNIFLEQQKIAQNAIMEDDKQHMILSTQKATALQLAKDILIQETIKQHTGEVQAKQAELLLELKAATNLANKDVDTQKTAQIALRASIHAAQIMVKLAEKKEFDNAILQIGLVTNLQVKTHNYSSFGQTNNLLINSATNVADATINNATISKGKLYFGTQSLHFDNTNIVQGNYKLNTNAQYIMCKTVNTMYYTNGITLSIWLNPSVLTSWVGILSLGNSLNDNITIGILNNCVYYGMHGSDWISSSLQINEWTHVAWTISGNGTHVLYINNIAQIPESNGKLLITNHIYQVCIGANSSIPWFYYNGYIGNVCIYNYVLNALQIETLFNGLII
jgi:hypothetical protein